MRLLICSDKVCYTLLKDSYWLHHLSCIHCRVFAHFICTVCSQTDEVSVAAGLCFNEWMKGADVICCDWCFYVSASWIRPYVGAGCWSCPWSDSPHQAVIFLQDVVTLGYNCVSSFDSVALCAAVQHHWWRGRRRPVELLYPGSFSVSLWQGDGVFWRWMSGLLVTKLFVSRLSSRSFLQDTL